jgi:hypothetical protein
MLVIVHVPEHELPAAQQVPSSDFGGFQGIPPIHRAVMDGSDADIVESI